MYVAAFASEVAFLDEFLGVVPRATGVGHEHCEHEARAEAAHEQAEHARHAEHEAREHGGGYGQERRHDHFALRAFGGYDDATLVVGFGFAGEDSFNGAELAAHFFYHFLCRTSNGVHRESAEQEGHHRADEHAGEYFGVH